MLKQRLLTALLLIPVFLLLLFKLSSSTFYFFTALIAAWGAWEWSYFMEIKSCSHRLLYLLSMVVALFIAYLLPLKPVLYTALAWWLMAAYLVIRYPKRPVFWQRGTLTRGVMGLLVLVPCWLAINVVRNSTQGVELLLCLFILIWGADSGAYFVGKKWGKHKLMPQVSPGKTWEGLLGALLVTLAISLVGSLIFKVPYRVWSLTFLGALVVVLFSILGDLFESMLKRQAGLKDSGNLLPGHGGILDRIDSLTAAAPIFALGLVISYWI